MVDSTPRRSVVMRASDHGGGGVGASVEAHEAVEEADDVVARLQRVVVCSASPRYG